MEAVCTIRQVAQQTGLSIDTLRYYERIGLIEPVRRAANGHRQYRQADLEWINLIMRLRETGMPLAQISYFAQLRRQGPQTTTERRLILEGHQLLLAQQMQHLAHHGQCDQPWSHCYWPATVPVAGRLNQRQEARRMQHRFRKAPESYLMALEVKLIKERLPT